MSKQNSKRNSIQTWENLADKADPLKDLRNSLQEILAQLCWKMNLKQDIGVSVLISDITLLNQLLNDRPPQTDIYLVSCINLLDNHHHLRVRWFNEKNKKWQGSNTKFFNIGRFYCVHSDTTATQTFFNVESEVKEVVYLSKIQRYNTDLEKLLVTNLKQKYYEQYTKNGPAIR